MGVDGTAILLAVRRQIAMMDEATKVLTIENADAGSPVQDDVTDAILTASRALVAVAVRSLADYEHEITLAQFRVLVLLAARGPQRSVDLASALGMSASTASRVCDRMVEKRLITRRRQSRDRREVRLDLSPAGSDLLNGVTLRRKAEIAQIVRAIPVHQQSQVVEAFTQVAVAAREIPDQEWHNRHWEI